MSESIAHEMAGGSNFLRRGYSDTKECNATAGRAKRRDIVAVFRKICCNMFTLIYCRHEVELNKLVNCSKPSHTAEPQLCF
jgi:hypothetical protein